jgi:hypothetical protein
VASITARCYSVGFLDRLAGGDGDGDGDDLAAGNVREGRPGTWSGGESGSGGCNTCSVDGLMGEGEGKGWDGRDEHCREV